MKHRRVSSHIVLCLATAFALLPCAAPHLAQAAPTATPAPYTGPVLTADQKAKISARQDKMTKEVAALRADKKLTDAQKQAKFDDLNKEFQADMQAILTPAQRAELQARRAEMLATRAKLQALNQKIVSSLTQDQKKKLQSLQENIQAVGIKIRDDKSLTDPQKFAKFETARKSIDSQVLKVFTPAQRVNYLQLLALEATLLPPGAAMAAHK